MDRLDKKDKFNVFLICLIYLIIAFIITHFEYVFGSEIDWGFQHFVFPEYFRMLFYNTGDLFPDFAFNIGGGQNIYYFAYYGLLSPIILISYLFPFVSMGVYIPLIMLLIGVFSICLFYLWIKGFLFDKKMCFLLTFMFAMAGPLLFHSHRHIMFVSYMPFLLLGLIGVRRYFAFGKKGLMIISVFLMIMTSYYYSVGGILCLTIYGIYEYLKRKNKFALKDFIKKGFNFALLIIIGVLMAGMILLPVIYALMNGRGESYGGVTLLEALIPSINLNFLLYKSYSIGLLSISFIAIIYLIFKRKEQRFLGVILSLLIICPIFVYILNGGLYLDGKALIPFLPLYVFSIGLFLKDVLESKANFKVIFLIIIISLTLVYLDNNSLKLYYTLGCGLFLVLYLLYKKYKKDLIIFIPLIIISFGVCLSVNLGDSLISVKDFQKQNDPVINEIIEDISNEDKSIYRMTINIKASNEIVNKIYNINENITTLYSSTYNTLYSDFFYNFNNNRASRNMFVTSEKGNSLFESYMGVKYLITDEKAPLGYKVWKSYGDYTVYINENALPLGYVTDRVLSEKKYDKLYFPDDSLALIGNAVAEDGDYIYESKVSKVNFDLSLGESKDLKIEEYKDGYKITVKKDKGTLKLDLKDNFDKIYLLRFTLENPQKCSEGDTSIIVNGIQNKLTCESWKYFNSNYTFDYTLNGNLDIEFSKGVYYIKKSELYSINYEDFINSYSDVSPFENVKIDGDKISGIVKVKEKGYFNLSIPYDKGFKIKVDGKEICYEKVNKAFIGFKIDKGNHKVEIEFEAPNAYIGKGVSLFGFITFAIIMIYQHMIFKKLT